MADRDKILNSVRDFLRGQKRTEAVDTDTELFRGGLGLDSLQTAELSVILEDELGRDPFSQGAAPQTIGEIVDFYETEQPVE